jgi:hypothetical protein
VGVFAKARAHESLTPAQRAFLKLVEGFIIAGVVAALPVLSLALGEDSGNWAGVGRVALGTFATAALMAAVKYLKAQGDPPLADALTTVARDVERWSGANDVGNKPAAAPGALPATLAAGNLSTAGLAADNGA